MFNPKELYVQEIEKPICKVMVGINVLTSIAADSYVSHMNFIYRCAKNFPKVQFYLHAPQRMSIDNMRNTTAKLALELECDYLCFIDDDVIVEPLLLKGLLEADKDIVAAETYIRGIPYNAMFFKFINGNLDYYNDFQKDVDKDGLVSCDAVGFSAVLIKSSLLSKLSTPYFVTGAGFTEDVYFCVKAREELGPDVSIYVDTKYPTAHRLNAEYVTAKNREALLNFHKEQNKALGIITPETLKDRGAEYHDQVVSLFGDDEHAG